MSDRVERLLAQARLEPTTPCTAADIEDAERRVAARVAARRAGTAPPPTTPRTGTIVPGCRHLVDETTRDLRVLCEVVVTRPRSLDHLGRFLDTRLPEPDGARVLGCLLFLAGCEDSARFWWQYAAGAGDPIAAYSLCLHHRAAGELEDADWWRQHTHLTPATRDSKEATEYEITTALRLLAFWRGDRTLPDSVRAVIEYVPAALAFVDEDLELPLPVPESALTALMDTLTARTRPQAGSTSTHRPLPARDEHPTARREEGGYWRSSDVITEALEACERTAC